MNRNSKLLIIAGVFIALAASIAMAQSRSNSSRTAWLGVYTQTVDVDIAREFDLDSDFGAIINKVVEDSPADEAGLREEDIIIAINGKKLRDADDLVDFIANQDPGDELTLKLIRRGLEKEVTVTLDGRSSRRSYSSRSSRRSDHSWTVPSAPRAPRAPKAPRAPRAPRVFKYGTDYSTSSSSPYIGVSLIELSDQLAEYFGTNDDIGILVSEVHEDSPAEEAGLKAGDVIVMAGKREIEETRDLQRAIRRLDEGDIINLQLLRDKSRINIEVEIGERDDDNWYGFNNYDDTHNLHQFYSLQGLRGLEALEGIEDIEGIFDLRDLDDLHELDIHIPDLRGMLYWDDDDDEDNDHYLHSFRFDTKEVSGEVRREMENLKRELKKLQRELDRGGR